MKKVFAWVLLLGLMACARQQDVVPYARVNYIIQKADPRFTQNSGVIFVSGQGVAGIIIYRRPDGRYVSYDQCSTYQPEKKCRVKLDETGIQVKDDCSESKYLLFDGSVVHAPAKRALRSYTVIETQYELQITN